MSAYHQQKWYYKWKTSVLKKQDHTCQITGSKDDVVVHHLYDVSSYKRVKKYVANGIVISKGFHHSFHYYFMGGYDKPCTPSDFLRFCKSNNYDLKFDKKTQKFVDRQKKHIYGNK